MSLFLFPTKRFFWQKKMLTSPFNFFFSFVPESNEFKNVRKEMVRFSGKVAKRIHNSSRNHDQKIRQISEDMKLLTDACPNIRKLNMVIHYKVLAVRA